MRFRQGVFSALARAMDCRASASGAFCGFGSRGGKANFPPTAVLPVYWSGCRSDFYKNIAIICVFLNYLGGVWWSLLSNSTYFRDAYRTHLDVLMSAKQILFDRRYAYVHAGVDPSLPLAKQKPHDLMWIREPFLQFDGPLTHVVVHGHTPNKEFIPEIKPNRIGIDTWAFRSGTLSCLAVSPDQDHLRMISARMDGISFVGVDGPAAAIECTI